MKTTIENPTVIPPGAGHVFNFSGHGAFAPDGRVADAPAQADVDAHNSAVAARELAAIKASAARTARQFGCTVEQAKALLAKNAAGFSEMAERAKRKGGRFNGYSEAELRQSAADYAEAAR